MTHGSSTPFHGIISRGLLRRFRQNGTPSATWLAYAHRIDDGPEEADEQLAAIRNEAWQCAVLTFGQSALAAQRYVESYCATELNSEPALCELWNVKEGHTSSVWHVAIVGQSSVGGSPFVVNVARDREAGHELERTSRKMQAIARRCPRVNMAKVWSADTVRIAYFGESLDVPVTRNEWVPDSYEIHRVTDQVAGRDRYLMIERFLAPADRPSHVRSIRGREFTARECRRIQGDINSFLTDARRQCPVDIDLNDGDVVWNGRQAIVVAIR